MIVKDMCTMYLPKLNNGKTVMTNLLNVMIKLSGCPILCTAVSHELLFTKIENTKIFSNTYWTIIFLVSVITCFLDKKYSYFRIALKLSICIATLPFAFIQTYLSRLCFSK